MWTVLGAKVRRKDAPHQTVESGPLPSLQTMHSQPHSLKKLRSTSLSQCCCCCYPGEYDILLENTNSLNPTEPARPHNPRRGGFLMLALSSWLLSTMSTPPATSLMRHHEAESWLPAASLRLLENNTKPSRTCATALQTRVFVYWKVNTS